MNNTHDETLKQAQNHQKIPGTETEQIQRFFPNIYSRFFINETGLLSQCIAITFSFPHVINDIYSVTLDTVINNVVPPQYY